MQPLDRDTLFSIFEQGDEEIYRQHGIEDTLNNPFVLMGMVINGLQNFELMNTMYARNYPKEYARVREGIKRKFYTKMYNYLAKIEDGRFEDVYNVGESYNSAEVYQGLDALRVYFEGLEEYEKCALIRNYITLLVDKVVPLNKNSYL